MTWKVYGNQFTTSDMTGKSQFLKFNPTKNIVLRAIRTWYVFYNDPTFSDLTCKLYGDQDGEPGALIATASNTFNKADLFSDDYALVEVYWEFNLIPLRQEINYHFVTNCSGYTYSENSHIAWRKGWPDNVYRTGLDLDTEEIHTSPFTLAVVADEL